MGFLGCSSGGMARRVFIVFVVVMLVKVLICVLEIVKDVCWSKWVVSLLLRSFGWGFRFVIV